MRPVPDKDVSISVSGMTITVVVEFPLAPDYDPVVTVSQALKFKKKGPVEGKPKSVTFTYEHTVQDPGTYNVDVVCSDKKFGDTVDVPAAASTSASFKYKKVK